MRIDPRDVQDIVALSPMQQSILLECLLNPMEGLYIEQTELIFQGPWSQQAAERSWKHLSAVNDSLRTIFRWEGLSEPVQIVFKERTVPAEYYSMTSLPAEDRERRSKKLMEEAAGKLDLGLCPIRLTFIPEAGRFRLVITHHHILFDGWSNALLASEFVAAYTEALGDRTQARPVKTPYKQFINYLQSVQTVEQEEVWKSYLKGFVQPPCKVSQSAGTTQDSSLEVYASGLDSRLEEAARLCAERGTTMSSLFQLAWGLTLQKFCGSDDVVFGTVVSGRNVPVQGIGEMVGLFMNTIPIRVRTHPGERLASAWERLDQSNRECVPSHHLPLHAIKQAVDKTNEPLFDTFLAVENYPVNWSGLTGTDKLRLESYRHRLNGTRFPLTVEILMINGFEIRFVYDGKYYSNNQVKVLDQEFCCILYAAASMIHAPVEHLLYGAPAKACAPVADFDF
ncbi:condensation domain-containing protein [Paenibacillus sp. FSL H7-0756]|uniref:condensation domain-containing protein n=2 Tax=Paenibacillus sp. FSL H7-0756 TaxID=2954738 RepID=UPI0030FC4B53